MSQRARTWTVSELLTWTRERFAQVGIEQPRVDAEHLLSLGLGCSRMDLYVQYDRLLTEDERGPFRELVRRRLAREPVAYITGTRGFHALDLDLEVDSRVLIPRPETEHLVDWVLEVLKDMSEGSPVVDIGTGSGAIALAIKRARPSQQVSACDRSSGALDVARKNAVTAGLDVTFYESDLLEAVPLPSAGFAVVVSNPPYIRSQDLATLQPEVQRFEPALALDGGSDGLDVIRRLIASCARPGVLRPGGWLMLEVGAGQAPEVAELLDKNMYKHVEMRKDLAGILRVVGGQSPQTEAVEKLPPEPEIVELDAVGEDIDPELPVFSEEP
ncbi:MAG: peptide chain release factor N(5)-glutamine methyltransferase [Nannocystaceae bacterium]